MQIDNVDKDDGEVDDICPKVQKPFADESYLYIDDNTLLSEANWDDSKHNCHNEVSSKQVVSNQINCIVLDIGQFDRQVVVGKSMQMSSRYDKPPKK